ncbi:toll/interleukin-1 receptor domain-containing protein [Lentiprolixibacter aurantiacus]|uniref:Toll/interleukin-1 receptor domain-containing protein n=1 Tax=Lentiprolixibacter aurantiacus TaxID=2993939 RepID=A0AAE3MN36_9FLAO|nr:toll/interleukin-1 receptor domain-containing protein [Lentiprolixibacter aurantiacus]MCX2719919.1 toll/interleukin-1 receptor domain-containing protein [Lentiprolixibacter aurantiacus]
MSSGSIFIVHSDKDLNVALEIAQMLKKAGAEVWIESLNLKNIDPDQDEVELVEKAILSSGLVAIVASKNALSDDWVKDQKGLAKDNGKSLFVVKAGPCDLSKKLRWRSIPMVDFQSDKNAAIAALLDAAGVAPVEVKQETPELETTPAEPASKQSIEVAEEVKEDKQSSSEEAALLADLKDDFEFYKFKLKQQIKNSRFNKILGVSIGAVLVAVAIFIPEFVEAIEGMQDKIQWAGGFVGGGLPTTFSGLNLNSEKVNKERLRGVQTFERRLNRMERGQISFTKNDIFALEDEFQIYIDA